MRPQYARKIFDGTKTVELRRVRPRVTTDDLVLVYASSPVKAMMGAFEIARVLTASPSRLWRKVDGKAGMTRKQFDEYFQGAKTGYGIFVKRKWVLPKSLKLESLRKRRSKFRPPQSYHYLTVDDVNGIGFAHLFRNGKPKPEPISRRREFVGAGQN